MKQIKALEAKLSYTFKDKDLLLTAITHSSYANEHKVPSYERLEFLGDSILNFTVAEFLFQKFVNLPEGQLTKMRANLVCEKSLCSFSKQLDLGAFVRLSYGEQRTGGSTRPSILADMFESIIAAIYSDSNSMETTKKFIIKYIEPAAKKAGNNNFKDYKTSLQEIIQQNPEEKLSYKLISSTGPDHSKHFVVEVLLNSNVLGKGGGKSKKEAEQQAARLALELMGY